MIRNRLLHRLFAVLLLMLVAVPVRAQQEDRSFEISKNLEIFSRLYQTLYLNYVDDVDPGATIKKAIDAMLASLDPYTVYYPESDIEDVKLQLLGQYGGIGSLIHQQGDNIYISEPYKGLPADQAGLKAGDRILAVARHWASPPYSIDGWRLDVADELPDDFIRRFKGRLRELDPEALLMGEVWEDASNKIAYSVRRRYFTDGELDSVMNYPWRMAILNFLRGADDGAALGESVMTIAENYPPQVLHALMNPLSTHDTPRILTALIGDFPGDREYQAQLRLSWEQRELAFERLRLAAFLQYTLPGCPCIYYGDEAGMEGCKDPFNRGCFPWGREDQRFVEFFRDLGRLKNNTSALRTGTVRVTAAGAGKLVFLRRTASHAVVCCVNRSGEPLWVEARHSLLSQNADRDGTGFTVRPGGFGCFEL